MSYLELTALGFMNIKWLKIFYLRTENGKKTSSFKLALVHYVDIGFFRLPTTILFVRIDL